MRSFALTQNEPALLLAPMEGVTDSPMRALLTERPGFTHTVTEFLRISHLLPPKKVFHWHLPELSKNSLTPTGIPINFQLLGGNPELLAQAALRATELGVKGIDLNFGCPAPTVNRHDGGATLLQYPERVKAIVRAVRGATPKAIPVSVKIRLGWHDLSLLYRNVDAAIDGGASSLAIHGRTKAQGYTPPAIWEPIRLVRKMSPIPVVANGDIWTIEDFKRCREVTECQHFMLGRSALANPFLASHVAKELGLAAIDLPTVPSPEDWRSMITRFFILSSPAGSTPTYAVKRTKQWLKFAYLRGYFPEFDQIKTCGTFAEIASALDIDTKSFSDLLPLGALKEFSLMPSTKQALKIKVNPTILAAPQSTLSLQ